MKNIFSQFGSKKVAGIVLAGATLVVGLGVVNNFSGGSQKAANEAALSRFAGDSAYNSFVTGSSSSRADLERQMSATQGGYKARFLTGKSDGTEPADAFSSDGAYTEGVRSYSGANGEYQPFNSTYEQGAGGAEFDANAGQGLDYGQAQFQSVQDAANAAAGEGAKGKGGKGAKGQSSVQTGRARPSTQIKKLGTSKGGSNLGGGNGSIGGGIRNGSTTYGINSATGGSDSNSVALPQARTGQADGTPFKFGRAGGIGGFNAAGLRGSESKGGRSRSTGAASDLQIAAAYSTKAQATRQEVGSKSLAEAAFDGSNPEDLTPTIPEGATIDQVASSLMRGLNIDMPDGGDLLPPDLGPELEETAQLAEELAALQNKLTALTWATYIGAILFGVGIFFLRKIPGWGTAAAIIASVAAVAFITGMCLWMNSVVEQMQSDKFSLVNKGIDWNAKDKSIIKTGISAGAISLYLGWSNKIDKIIEQFKNWFGYKPKMSAKLLEESVNTQVEHGLANPSAPVNLNNLDTGETLDALGHLRK